MRIPETDKNENIRRFLSEARARRELSRLDDAALDNYTHRETLSRFQELQEKVARKNRQEAETGFLPKLDARLAVALTAMNNNDMPDQPETPKIVYSTPYHGLDIET